MILEQKREIQKRDAWIANVKRIYAIGDLEAILMYKKVFPDKVTIEYDSHTQTIRPRQSDI